MTPLLFIAGQRMSSLPQQSGRHFCLLLYNPFVHSSFPTESARFAKSTPGIRMKSESSRKRDYSVGMVLQIIFPKLRAANIRLWRSIQQTDQAVRSN
jgi:hypothetical protein